MKTLHIDSYKVPAVDPCHIIHMGGGVSLPPRIVGFIDDSTEKYTKKQIMGEPKGPNVTSTCLANDT